MLLKYLIPQRSCLNDKSILEAKREGKMKSKSCKRAGVLEWMSNMYFYVVLTWYVSVQRYSGFRSGIKCIATKC